MVTCVGEMYGYVTIDLSQIQFRSNPVASACCEICAPTIEIMDFKSSVTNTCQNPISISVANIFGHKVTNTCQNPISNAFADKISKLCLNWSKKVLIYLGASIFGLIEFTGLCSIKSYMF
jgi:hypothetical protein